jgi:hypothetical protein
MPSMKFLANVGLFYHANKNISENNLEALSRLIQQSMESNDLETALAAAQKASIEHGLDGLCLYFPIKIKAIQKDIAEGELPDQEIIKTISLIKYALNDVLPASTIPTEQQSSIYSALKAQKNMLLALVKQENSPVVESESDGLVAYYRLQ